QTFVKTIRVQSPEGTKRICSTKRESASSFVKKVAKEFGFSDNGFTLFKGRNKTDAVNHKSRLHGDMLYLIPNTVRSMSPPDNMDTSSPSLSRPTSTSVLEDEIDVCLAKQDGKIDRIRDAQLCRHGPMGRCVHCVPLEPFDEDYLNHLDPPVKHMSFHAYIRKLTGGADKGKFVALENISCKIKAGCEGHPLWPEGICTKCQPSAITLNRQVCSAATSLNTGMNVMFENYTIADRFLNSWRRTGGQRLGYLYGRYAEHKDISLGIRAEIAAIYEPPQEGSANSLDLLPDPKAEVVDEIAAKLGLRKVMLFIFYLFIFGVGGEVAYNVDDSGGVRAQNESGCDRPKGTGKREGVGLGEDTTAALRDKIGCKTRNYVVEDRDHRPVCNVKVIGLDGLDLMSDIEDHHPLLGEQKQHV
uniref:NPL4 homolog, ubiquitin recognition factor n=1 Tax=Eptatretus burgeri TaxID=7764 RepID=A0A8C4MZI4_EPTBU